MRLPRRRGQSPARKTGSIIDRSGRGAASSHIVMRNCPLAQARTSVERHLRANVGHNRSSRSHHGKRHRAPQGSVSILGHAPHGYRYIRESEHSPACFACPKASATVSLIVVCVPLCSLRASITASFGPASPPFFPVTLPSIPRCTALPTKSKSNSTRPSIKPSLFHEN
jgi:hypothetical protein